MKFRKTTQKHFQIEFILLLLGYLLISIFINSMVNLEQNNDIKGIWNGLYQSKQLNKLDNNKITELNKAYNIHLVELPNQSRDHFVSTVKDIANSEPVVNGYLTTEQVNNKKRLIYVKNTNEDQIVGVVKTKKSFFSVSNKIFLAFSLFYLIFMIIFMLIDYSRQLSFQRNLGYMNDNLRAIADNRTIKTIIYDKNSRFYQLNRNIKIISRLYIKQQNKLKLRKGNFNNLVNHLPLGIMIVDGNRQSILRNSKMEEILEKRIRNKPHSYLDDIYSFELSNLIEKSIKNKRSYEAQINFISKHEKLLNVEVIYFALSDGEENFLVIISDVTYKKEIKHSERSLSKSIRDQLNGPVERIVKDIDQFSDDDISRNNQLFNDIKHQASRLKRYKINTELIERKFTVNASDIQSFNLYDSVESIYAEYNDLAMDKRVKLVNEVPKDFMVTTEPKKLKAAIKKLVKNSIVFNIPEGKVIVNAYVSDDDNYRIVIKDDGLGISFRDKKHIFEKFYRGKSSRPMYHRGTGLGLTVAQKLINAISGDIKIDSKVGEYTEVVITLPSGEQLTSTKVRTE